MALYVCLLCLSVAVMAVCAVADLVIVEQNRSHLDLEMEGVEEKSAVSEYILRNSSKFQGSLTVVWMLMLVLFAVSLCGLLAEAELCVALSVVGVILLLLLFSVLNLSDNKRFHSAYVYGGYVIYWLWRPVTKLVNFLMFSGVESSKPSVSRVLLDETEEREGMVSEEVKEENEVEIFRNALDFSTLKLKNIFVPRTEIVAIDIEAGVEELRELFIETNYSRILVYRGNIDSIVGYAHCSDIFDKPDDIASILNPLIVVSEEMNANTLLHILQTQRKSLALAVDEFGGTAGIITMEDIMEEIFGDIDDEYDEKDDRVMKRLSSGEYVLSGRLDVEDVNEKFNIQLPVSGDYETIAGLVLAHNNILPGKGDHVVVNGKYDFHILVVEATRIVLVKMKLRIKS